MRISNLANYLPVQLSLTNLAFVAPGQCFDNLVKRVVHRPGLSSTLCEADHSHEVPGIEHAHHHLADLGQFGVDGHRCRRWHHLEDFRLDTGDAANCLKDRGQALSCSHCRLSELVTESDI